MTHVASPTSIEAAISPVKAPAGSWWTFWAPTAISGSASASASRTAARATNGGQMTRTTSGSRVRPAMVRASSPASAGVVCIFQLAATITSRIVANHARAATSNAARWSATSRATPARRRPRPDARAARVPAGPLIGGSPSRSASSDRVASGVARRAGGDHPNDRRLDGKTPVGIERRDRVQLAARRHSPPRSRFADSAFSTRLSSPRSVRETWRASSSRSAPLAPIRRRNVLTSFGALPRDHAATPTDPPRRGQLHVGQTRGENGGIDRVHHEFQVRPAPGEAQRPTGQKPSSQPGGPTVVRRARPVERRRASRPASRIEGEPPAGRPGPPVPARRREPTRARALRRRGRTSAAGSMAASSARRAFDQVPFRAGHPCTPPIGRQITPSGR